VFFSSSELFFFIIRILERVKLLFGLLRPNLISHGLKGKSRGRFVEDLNRDNRILVNDLFPAVQWISRKPEIQREQEIS